MKKRIVYIEDDREMIQLVTLILSRRGYDVNGALSGPDGIELANKLLPDLILLDIMMPGMDGWEVIQILKASEKTKNIPVVIISARSQQLDHILGLHVARAEEYLNKPFKPVELINTISRIIGSDESPVP